MIILIGCVFIILILYIIFLTRAPVLLIQDAVFSSVYGQDRLKKEIRQASLELFRPVKIVEVADDAADDVIPHAIIERSSRPYCVLFPLRFARSARQYRELEPKTRIIILEGRFGENSNPSHNFLGGTSFEDYFIYKTDIEHDFRTAAYAAILLLENIAEDEENRKIGVLLESGIFGQGREAFTEVINELENQPNAFFFSDFNRFNQNSDYSCVVMTGIGSQFLESNSSEIPVIFFTWLDPELLSDDVVMILNDSPVAQIARAVKMADQGLTEGKIQSKIFIKNSEKINKRILHKMLK